MGIEGFNKQEIVPKQPEEEVDRQDEYEKEKFYSRSVEKPEGIDFSSWLGEGFDAEFFADKLGTFPHDEMFDRWNDFLEQEEDGKYKDRTVERGLLNTIAGKISGTGSAPLMFPVFIQGIQDHYEKKGISSDHVTPERMEEFYTYMSGA